jgi:hypothetical protein
MNTETDISHQEWPTEVQAFQNLFNGFHAIENKYFQSAFQEETCSFKVFQERFRPFDAKMNDLLQRDIPYFNIFSILNIGHLEEKLHTPFLGHLLNPKANHTQGALFLDTFLNQVLGLKICFSQMSYFDINEESNVETGRLDIIINYGVGKDHKAIVIENKTKHVDQQDQLERYFFQMKCLANMPLSNFQIVYLTPRCNRPTAKSIHPKLADSLRQHNVLLEVGYHKHILPWLTDCHPQVKSENMKSILSQYINTIKRL